MGREHKFKGVAAASDTSLVVRFPYQGRWVRVFVPVRPTASALAAWAHKRAVIVEEIRLGQFAWGRWFPWAPPPPELRACRPNASVGTIADLLNSWLTRCERELETTSWRKCRQVIDRCLIPAFGAIPAERLVPGDIQDWIAGHELARKTTSNYLWPLRRALHQAAHVDRTLESDPLVNYRVPRRRIDKARHAERLRHADPFLDLEIKAALAVAQPDLAPFVLFNIWSGLRLEEMFELHWEDIDQIGGRIWVHRARVRLLVKGTKTPSSTRYVRLLPRAKGALDLARPQSYLGGAHIFICLRSGLPWREEMLRLAWQRTCLRAGVRYRPAKHFHHTYAHRMLTAGEDLAFISRELGHKDLAVTARIYAGLLDKIGAGQDTFGQRANAMYGEDVPLSSRISAGS